MNKVLLVVCLLILALTGVNTFLFFQMTTKLKEAVEHLEPATRAMEKVQPLLQELSDKRGPVPAGTPPTEPPGAKKPGGKTPVFPSATQGAPPFPSGPGPFPKP